MSGSPMRVCYLFPLIPIDKNDKFSRIKQIYSYAISMSASSPDSAMTIICPDKAVFVRVMKDILPYKTCAALSNNKLCITSENVRINLLTTRTIDKNPIPNTVLCLYAHLDLMKKISNKKGIESLIVATELEDAYLFSKSAFSPIFLTY